MSDNTNTPNSAAAGNTNTPTAPSVTPATPRGQIDSKIASLEDDIYQLNQQLAQAETATMDNGLTDEEKEQRHQTWADLKGKKKDLEEEMLTLQAQRELEDN